MMTNYTTFSHQNGTQKTEGNYLHPDYFLKNISSNFKPAAVANLAQKQLDPLSCTYLQEDFG